MPTAVPARAAAALLAAAAALSAAPPAAAAAVPFQIVTFRNTFFTSEIVLPAGSSLELTNLDLERHDVTALDGDGTGMPLFRSRTIGPAQHAVVEGVTVLAPSVYPFYCSVHAEMVGNITVL